MKRIASLVCGGMFIAAVLAQDVTKSAESADEKALQGTWTPLSAELGGTKIPPTALEKITLKNDGNQYEVTIFGKKVPDRGYVKLDSKANPKTITITSTNGPNQGKTFLAIYELQGEMYRVCYDLSGAKRPTEFKTEPGTQLYLVTYQRKKTD